MLLSTARTLLCSDALLQCAALLLCSAAPLFSLVLCSVLLCSTATLLLCCSASFTCCSTALLFDTTQVLPSLCCTLLLFTLGCGILRMDLGCPVAIGGLEAWAPSRLCRSLLTTALVSDTRLGGGLSCARNPSTKSLRYSLLYSCPKCC